MAGGAKKCYPRRTRKTQLIANGFPSPCKAFWSYLVHTDPSRRLYVDLDESKEFGFGAMVHHEAFRSLGRKRTSATKSRRTYPFPDPLAWWRRNKILVN